MLFRFDREALFIAWFESVHLSQNTFKVCINYVWDFHLFVVARKGHLVLSHFWHLRSGWTFQQPFAFWFVPFEQISRCISVQTAFAEMFCASMLCLVKQLSRESFHIAVMCVFALLRYHQVYSADLAVFFTDSMNYHFFQTRLWSDSGSAFQVYRSVKLALGSQSLQI